MADLKAQEQELVYALDIGTRSVVGVVGRPVGDRLKVLDVEMAEHGKRAMMDGQIDDIKQVGALAQTVTQRLESRLGIRLERVCVAAAGRALRTQAGTFTLEFPEEQSIDAEQISRLEAGAVSAAEEGTDYWKRFRSTVFDHTNSISDAISHTSCLTAMDLGAAAILAATQSGYTARMISRFRPGCAVAALTTEERVRRQLAISWGVVPFLSGNVDSTDRLFFLCVDTAKKEGLVQSGDTVVITAGVPLSSSGTTNLIKAQVVK